MIKEFFVVTETSVYHVVSEPLSATKIYSYDEGSSIPLGSALKGGEMLSVGRFLIKFIPEGGGLTSFNRNVEMVNTRYWGDNTSGIVAMFLNRAKALKCARELAKPYANCKTDMYDQRWKEDTKAVLDAIGSDHPNISICRSSSNLGIPRSFIG